MEILKDTENNVILSRKRNTIGRHSYELLVNCLNDFIITGNTPTVLRKSNIVSPTRSPASLNHGINIYVV